MQRLRLRAYRTFVLLLSLAALVELQCRVATDLQSGGVSAQLPFWLRVKHCRVSNVAAKPNIATGKQEVAGTKKT
jgi:hypothetical protein